MALTANLKAVLNRLVDYIPGLVKEGELTKLKLGDLLDIDAKIVAIATPTLAAAATTAVTVAGSLVTDMVFASIRTPNTGATVAVSFNRAYVSAAGTVTLVPNATPSTADGVATIIVVRAVTAQA